MSLVISMFHDIFYSQIEQLVTGFPEDYIKKEDGKPFWSGTKRFPRQIELNVEDPIHLDIIIGGANILATCIGLPM